jgi:8-oxo-dGTP pyrophosphatase MutT (NUDIX family)
MNMTDKLSNPEALPPETARKATPAATMVIMHRDPDGGPPKILMMERVKAMAFAGGAAVFPGGKVDDADFDYAQALDQSVTLGLEMDEVASRLAVIRETIEEAGLALGLRGVDDPADCIAARTALHEGVVLSEICGEFGWIPDLAQLTPWARWQPPLVEKAPRIFDTRFYLVDAGEVQLNAIVDATENKMLFWASANDVLAMADEDKVKIIYPTRRNLERLAQFDSIADVMGHANQHPVIKISPHVEKRDEGLFLCIPDGIGYPVTAELLDTAKRW